VVNSSALGGSSNRGTSIINASAVLNGGGGGGGVSIKRDISGSASSILAVKGAAGLGAGLIAEAKV
jgi:hypothetical protein